MIKGSINCALRNSIHQSTGNTPYQILFGQNMITHGKDYEVLRNLKVLEDSDSVLTREDKFELVRSRIQEKLKTAFERNEKHYNLRCRKRELYVGQHVFRRNFVQSSLPNHFSSKLAPTGIKAEVMKKSGQLYYELKDCGTGKLGTYHAKDIWT